jgi:hypothetical protein
LAIERLQLRSELYKPPETVDDRVGAIIEQAGKIISGSKTKQRALLIEACTLLAQEIFQVVLDSENPNGEYCVIIEQYVNERSLAIGKMRANPTAQLRGFAEHYERCLQNIVQYQHMIHETDSNKRYSSTD